MTFNVENLLRPNKDWTADLLREKIKRISKVIEKSGLPDIVVFQEVGDVKLLEEICKEKLSVYENVILLQGQDKRGINVGIISKLPIHKTIKTKIHNLKLNPPKRTRPILESTFVLPDGTPLTILGFHFPSQNNPKKLRVQAVNILNDIVKNKRAFVIACGDANITKSEEYIWDNGVAGYMCSKDLMNDVPGTNYYQGEWSLLDVFYFNEDILDKGVSGWKLKDYQIYNKLDIQSTIDKGQTVPQYFGEETGVSDHYPVILKLYK